MAPFNNLPRSSVLLLGSNSVQSLLPATLTSQIESLLENRRFSEAVAFADQHRKRLQAKPRVEQNERDEIAFIYQCIGFVQLQETSFEEAGRSLFFGELDPRILVSYFPELRGDLFSEDDAVDMFAGAAKYMPQEASVDEIIAANLVLNYSPHLPPNTREATPAVELQQILRYSAEQAVEDFLWRFRVKLRVTDKEKAGISRISAVVDSVLVLIYAKTQKTRKLHTLLTEPNDVILGEVEATLIATQQFFALCKLYERTNQDEKLLETWAKLADGEWVEVEANLTSKLDPVDNMEALLATKRDRALIARWAIWLMKKDPDRGLRLILSRDSGKRPAKTQEDEDVRLLAQIQEASPTAAQNFLEYLIFQKRSVDPALHMQLATLCVEQLRECLADESVHKLWRAKTSSYTSNPPPSTSFLSYFAGTTPDSDSKRTRLKSILFLQGSAFYSPEPILEKLSEVGTSEILALEVAIVQGKLKRHHAALGILVNILRDATSAEVYCGLGGVIVPMKIAYSLGESHNLMLWASVLFPVPRGLGAAPMSRQPSGNDDLRKSLVKTLLGVYMEGGEINAGRTTRLLNSQAMSVDVLDVITLIPDDWSVNSMSSFLTRSLRRSLHTKHEGQIVKNIAMSQNMKVKEDTWLVIREQGGIVEEVVDSDSDNGEVSEKVLNEKDTVLVDEAIEFHDEKTGWDDVNTEQIGLQ